MKKVRAITTDDVRVGYSEGTYDDQLAGTEFDLWLVTERNRVAELAIAKERKRIFVSIMANVNKTIAAAKRGDNPIDMTWLYEELMKADNDSE